MEIAALFYYYSPFPY
jgi:hypothetical protein